MWGTHCLQEGAGESGANFTCFMGEGSLGIVPFFSQVSSSTVYLLLAQCAASLVAHSDISAEVVGRTEVSSSG